MADSSYRALLVANAMFDEDPHNLPLLIGPGNDSSLLYQALSDEVSGFFVPSAVKVVQDARDGVIREEIESIFNDASSRDTVLLYYSGHGRLDLQGQLYLCASNTRSDLLRATAIGSNWISEVIDGSAAAVTIIILDCCHSGAFRGSDMAEILSGHGRYVISSTRAAELARDSDADNGASLFTASLADGLRGEATDADGDGLITLDDIYNYVHARLRSSGKQIPHKRFNGDGNPPIARRIAADGDPSRPPKPASKLPTQDASADMRHPVKPNAEGAAGEQPTDYLAVLPEAQQRELARANKSGWTAMRDYLASGEAVAFLGAGASAPLFPTEGDLIGQLVDGAADRVTESEVAACRALTPSNPEEVVEIVRRSLGPADYRELLRQVLRSRTDPKTGRSWTPVQELVCRCAFRGVVTTAYDPGIVNARMRVRHDAAATGFTTWQDELGLDEWRTGRVFREAELPVLYAHGQHNQPDSIILATTEYRRAYAGKLPHVLGTLVDAGHLVWIGFSFADQRIAAILREIAERSGTRIDPGAAPRHVAIMPWDPAAEGNDPGILARRAEISFGARAVLYPAPRKDHSALTVLLAALADPSYPPAVLPGQ
jgi:hypothetical protein